ncbi:hypothetical protein [Mangrovimonas xylaniphaga]|uniref:hypothetical protein n=1 Tax=Mangrovimonas xylaniphaga TaxID=1645915 RepID=UPI0006B67A49|nr:hypothetical protein [Mangrovimonas xylaniphaga]
MKYILLLFTLSAMVLTSCDGRQSSRESLQQSISEFNQKQTPLELISFYPKEYTEVETDTIMSNNLRVNIKNYSLMDQEVIQHKKTIGNNKDIQYHRAFESEIAVYNANQKIYTTTINAHQFQNKDNSSFWNNATLEHVWVNHETSGLDWVNLEITFIDPQTHAYRVYEMTIDHNGKQDTFLKEQNS